MHAFPIESLEQSRELRGRQMHRAVLHSGPMELAILKPLGDQAYATAIPEYQFDAVGSLGPEHIDVPENGSAPISAFTNAANPSAPLRKSTGLVAIMTFTAPDGPITTMPS